MSKKKPERTPPESLHLPRVGVETHAHLDSREFRDDLTQVLDRAAASGIAAVGQVFLGPDAYRANKTLFDGRPEVFFLLGVHPTDADKCSDATLAALDAAFASDDRIRAMGEIGLDFYWKDVPPEKQYPALRAQLALARERDLRVVVHSRDAFAETLAVLDDMGFRDRPLLWHCFGGDEAMARELLARGWLLSIPGPVTYSKNVELARAVAAADMDRLVVETDCPYLTPEPWRGKRNEPALAVFTAARIAQLKGLPIEEAWRRMGRTAAAFFGLELPE